MSAQLRAFLAGTPARPNAPAPPSFAARYRAAAGALFTHDPDRVAAIRDVAERRGADLTRYTPTYPPRPLRWDILRRHAREFSEALAIEGLLPTEWADAESQPWGGWSPERLNGPFSPHEAATLAAWAPRLATAREAHAQLVSAAQAWGLDVGEGLGCVTDHVRPLVPPFNLPDHLGDETEFMMDDTALSFPAGAAARSAIAAALGVEHRTDGPRMPEEAESVTAFAEDVLGLRPDAPDERSVTPPGTTYLDQAIWTLQAWWLVEEAARRGLWVPDLRDISGLFPGLIRSVVRREPSVVGRLFGEVEHPAPALHAISELGLAVARFDAHGIAYLLRGFPT